MKSAKEITAKLAFDASAKCMLDMLELDQKVSDSGRVTNICMRLQIDMASTILCRLDLTQDRPNSIQLLWKLLILKHS